MACRKEEVLLEGEFYVVGQKRMLNKVTLIPAAIFYSQLSTERAEYEEGSLQMCDVIGCSPSSTMISPSRNNDIASFTVFAYPFRKRMFTGRKNRHRKAVTFEVGCGSTLEKKNCIALQWTHVISCLARGRQVNLCDVERCVPPPWGTFLVLVNPHSGTGRAMQIFKEQVEPMLGEADIPFKLVTTEYAGHAYNLMHNLQLPEWAAVVIVSGDGLVHEVINGLMQRVDWATAIKTPVGCVPGGSGNALVSSINYAAGEPVQINPVLHATFILIKHRVVPMDIVLVKTPTKQSYSFLSVTWGLIADVDFESEKYRFLGEIRFILGTIKRIVNLQAYKGTLSFLPVAEYEPKTAKSRKNLKKIRRFSLQSTSSSSGGDGQDAGPSAAPSSLRAEDSTLSSSDKALDGGCLEDNDASFTATGQTGIETEAQLYGSPHTLLNNTEVRPENNTGVSEAISSSAAVVDVTSSTEIHSNANQSAYHARSSGSNSSANETGSAANTGASSLGDLGVMSQQKHRMSITITKHGDIEEEIVNAKKVDGWAVPTPLLPALDQPVPEEWMVIEGKFVMFLALYQSHIGSDLFTAPSARLSDGVIHLVFVQDGISFRTLITILASLSSGTHVDLPDVETVPVLAFRLEPEKGGHIMVDGEQMETAPLQCQVLPGLGRVMAIQ